MEPIQRQSNEEPSSASSHVVRRDRIARGVFALVVLGLVGAGLLVFGLVQIARQELWGLGAVALASFLVWGCIYVGRTLPADAKVRIELNDEGIDVGFGLIPWNRVTRVDYETEVGGVLVEERIRAIHLFFMPPSDIVLDRYQLSDWKTLEAFFVERFGPPKPR